MHTAHSILCIFLIRALPHSRYSMNPEERNVGNPNATKMRPLDLSCSPHDTSVLFSMRDLTHVRDARDLCQELMRRFQHRHHAPFYRATLMHAEVFRYLGCAMPRPEYGLASTVRHRQRRTTVFDRPPRHMLPAYKQAVTLMDGKQTRGTQDCTQL